MSTSMSTVSDPMPDTGIGASLICGHVQDKVDRGQACRGTIQFTIMNR